MLYTAGRLIYIGADGREYIQAGEDGRPAGAGGARVFWACAGASFTGVSGWGLSYLLTYDSIDIRGRENNRKENMKDKALKDLTASELEIIYLALTSECVELAKGFDLNARDEWGDAERRAYNAWIRVGNIQRVIYRAQIDAEDKQNW